MRKQIFIENNVNSCNLVNSPPLLGLNAISDSVDIAELYINLAQVNLFHIRGIFCLLLRIFTGLKPAQPP